MTETLSLVSVGVNRIGMQYAAAALVFVAGNQEATERAYRMADKMATLK